MDRWRASESCSLVGIGSIGKSNLLRHLVQTNLQKKHLPDPKQYIAIIINPNLLGPLGAQDESVRCWAGFELMLHRLYIATHPFEMLDKEEAGRFFQAYRALQDGSNPLFAYMGLRYLEVALDIILRRDYQIIFMFDEFEELLRRLPLTFFQNLRGLRDEHKAQLAYLTLSRNTLPEIINQRALDVSVFEPFAELFSDNTRYIAPYNEQDSHHMLERLETKTNRLIDQKAKPFLLWATGGHAGLLRALFWLVQELDFSNKPNAASQEGFLDNLIATESVQSECKAIWDSLLPAEHRILSELAKNTLRDADEHRVTISSLLSKSVLKRDEGVTIVPPLFRAYIADHVLSGD